MQAADILRVIYALLALGVFAVGRWQGAARVARAALLVAAGANILFVVFVFANHITFPLHLDLMEGTVLQHFRQIMAGQPIYPAPTPEYVPLAYNPLYYVLAVPFGWLLGADLPTLRLVAILGWALSALILYAVVREKTRSTWWAWLAVGLFAAAYRAMDAYLDTAHSDSWLLGAALLGTYLLEKERSGAATLGGVAVLVAAFWFKQHGALFVIGGVAYVTWRDGFRRAWPAWAVAILLGPLAYLFLGPRLFGPYLHYFTWRVPAAWTELNLATFRRLAVFVAKAYPVLAVATLFGLASAPIWRPRRLSIWQVQGIMAALTAFMGALDSGSSNNVFIAMGAWLILLGALALHAAAAAHVTGWQSRLPLAALACSLAFLAYNPADVIVPSRADAAYADLLTVLRSLDGPVYAPTLGQLRADYTLYPAAHWVALEDLVRGPGRDTQNAPLVRALLRPALEPAGQAYVLANLPLDAYPVTAFLEEDYVLETDLGDRFRVLRALPGRFESGWPRYLYRYALRQAILGPVP